MEPTKLALRCVFGAGTENGTMKRIAVIGASNNRAKYGNRAVRAYRDQGYEVYPVHPRESEIEGLKAYPSVREVPERPDRVTIYLPPEVTLRLLPEIAERGCDELWLNPGAESEQLAAEAARLGLNVIQACSIVALGRESRL
jgi:predicted CoA-binding protein